MDVTPYEKKRKFTKFLYVDGNSLRCPSCGSALHGVAETRAHAGSIYRRRKCKKCKNSFITHEYSITTSDKFWEYLGKQGKLYDCDGKESEPETEPKSRRRRLLREADDQ